MKIGGRLAAAIEILKQIETEKLPASEVLRLWAQAHRFAGSKDRAFIGNIVYDVLRKRSSLAVKIDSEDVSDLAFASLLDEDEYTLETLESLLAEDKFSNYFLPPGRRSAWLGKDQRVISEQDSSNMPFWLFEKFQEVFAEDALAEAEAFSTRPPLDLRINLLKASAEKLLHSLKHITSLEQVSWFKTALRVPPLKGAKHHPNVQIEPSFQKGWFEVQDLGSQLLSFLPFAYIEDQLSPFSKGLQILDYCAGAGGKTLALASYLQNRGQIHAHDKDKTRLAPIFMRLKRAGVRNCQVYSNKDLLSPLKGKIDLTICDVPCTGSGVWRRHPDSKWRMRVGQIIKRQQEQKDILHMAKDYVKPGKFLAYMTCSIFEEENDKQIDNFLAEHKEFFSISLQDCWKKLIGRTGIAPFFTKYGLLFTPARTGTDGFYLSLLQKSDKHL